MDAPLANTKVVQMFQGRPVAHTISSHRSHAASCQPEICTGLVMIAGLRLKTLLWSKDLVVITWCPSILLGSSSRVGGLCLLITSVESTRLQSYGACYYLSSDAFRVISDSAARSFRWLKQHKCCTQEFLCFPFDESYSTLFYPGCTNALDHVPADTSAESVLQYDR